ncbi:MAG: methyl-accepting chemotaxis protein [Gammaproteobacteria bacterium]|nr:methyl-accepting chemotaxis protein [Gammaproteobacteria bacterium]
MTVRNRLIAHAQLGSSAFVPKSTPMYGSSAYITNSTIFFLAPLGSGVLAIVPLLIMAGWNLHTIISAVLVLMISSVVGWRLKTRFRSIVENQSCEYSKTQIENCNFCKQIFPIWSRQIETSRAIGEEAVADLASIFGEIVKRLGTILKTSGGSSGDGQGKSDDFDLLGAVGSSQEDFKSLFKDLNEALVAVNNSKEVIVAEVKKYSKNMSEIAEEAQRMAMQSQIVALNAEIEAARLGVDGRAFAAVVSEMRGLAKKSIETSKIMAQKVCSIDETIEKLDEFYQNGKEFSDMGAHTLSRAEGMFEDIIERFSKITEALENNIVVMENESRQVRDDISSATMVLQFQDRLSQVLDHVTDNIIELKDSAGLGVRKIDASVWIRNMESKYSVDEEYGTTGRGKASLETPGLVTMF